MDLTVLLIAASTLVILIVATLLLKNKFVKQEIVEPQARGREAPAPRRAQAVRNVRQRMRANAPAEDSDEDDPEPEKEDIKLPSGKIGTKKRAKLEAKAERKARQEVEEREREERKKRREAEDEERKREEEREKSEEEARLAEEKRLREEKEKREHEEYLKLKATFSVSEEGFEQGDEDEGNLLQEFVKYIKCNKVVILEDLAAHFKLKTQNVIERIQDFQANGTLTGVIDDRGKFIYVSEEELQAVANFVKQRGRVSIAELAESSNHLINLSPIEISS